MGGTLDVRTLPEHLPKWFAESCESKGRGDGSGYGFSTSATVDGQITQGEYQASAEGRFGTFYLAAVDSDSFQFLNDWRLRSDEPICPAMYNRFQFNTGCGKQHWEVRVYGDQSITILLNGSEYTEGSGGYSFGPSLLEPTPHTIFEFRVDGISLGSLCAFLSDPGPGAEFADGGCSDPAAALVPEPTVVLA